MKHIIIDNIIKQIKGAKSSIFTLDRRKFAMPEIEAETEDSFNELRKLYLAESPNTVFVNDITVDAMYYYVSDYVNVLEYCTKIPCEDVLDENVVYEDPNQLKLFQ